MSGCTVGRLCERSILIPLGNWGCDSPFRWTRLEKPCCMGSYFHEDAAVPLWAVVEAGEVHFKDACQHAGQCLIIAVVAAKAAYPQTLRENPRDRALRPEGRWFGWSWSRLLGGLAG